MKKILLTMLASAAVVASSYAQGTISFANGANQLITLNGVSAAAAAGVKVQILWAPIGVTDVGLFTAGPVVNVGTPLAGRFSGGTTTVGLVGDGNNGGNYNIAVRGYVGVDWASATATGVSSFYVVDTGDPTTSPAGTPTLFTTVTAFTGLNVTSAVPEPSSMALAGLGAASLLMFRRRK
jgi:hypothetical protein